MATPGPGGAAAPAAWRILACYVCAMAFSDDELAAVLRVLQALADDRALLADIPVELRNPLLHAAGRVSRPARHERKQFNRTLRRRELQQRRAHDARLLSSTINREARRSSTLAGIAGVLTASTADTPEIIAGEVGELLTPRSCYICKSDY